MSSGEIKAALKEAREALKTKDFKAAAAKCKEVLKHDENHYMALVLIGAALQESDAPEAAKYLRKAAKLPNNNLALALQGLSLCADPTEMPDIGRKLLELTPDRFLDIHAKLLKAAVSSINLASDVSPFVQIYENDTKHSDEARRNSAFYHLARLYILNAGCSANVKWQQLFVEALGFACGNPGLDDQQNVLDVHLDLFKAYLKLLYKVSSLTPETLLKECCAMNTLFEKEIYPLEWICKVFVDRLEDADFDTVSFLENPIEVYADRLLVLSPNSTLGLMTKAINLYEQQQYLLARDTLLRVNNLQRNWKVCLGWLAQTLIQLGAHPVAETLLRHLPDKDIRLLECIVAQAEQDKNKAREAIQLSAELLPKVPADQQPSIIFLMAKSMIFSGQFEKATKTIAKLADMGADDLATIAEALLHLNLDEPTKASEVLTSKPNSSSAEHAQLLGQCQIRVANYPTAIPAFTLAAKLEPYNSHHFYWLGQTFLKTAGSKYRAIKCFEKCLHLNSRHEAATCLLSGLYRESKDAKANETILARATADAVPGVVGPCPWVYPLLGAQHMSEGKFNDAVSSYRMALRERSDDIASWEGLADAYQQRGSLNSALKVYQKCLEMGSEQSQYARLQVANVKSVLGFHQEAVDEFKEMLSEDEHFVPALKGMAEAHLGLAKHNLERKLFGRSREHAREAVTYLTRAIGRRNDMAVLWRLLANALDAIASLSAQFATLVVSGQLANVPNVEQVTLVGDELYALAGRCYCRAVKIRPQDSLIWYELAVNYYNRAMKYGNSMERANHLGRSLAITKYVAQLCSSSWLNWNLLGVICSTTEIRNAPLAQHAFIKAVQLNRNAAIAWTNLGVLYQREAGDVRLANRAFGRAQQAQTDYVNGWTGQACLAEQLGHPVEAMDLFQHATTLQYTAESALGFVHWICMALSDEELYRDAHVRYVCERMFGSTGALDSIEWYHRHENRVNVQTLCFAGYLYHSKGMWSNAVRAFTKALEQPMSDQIKDKILFNLGVSLLRNGEPEHALQVFHAVTEATFDSTIGLAIAHYKSGQVAEAYSVYESALNLLASTDAQKSQILVAMSAIVYTFQGEQDAKSLLFQCIGLPQPPVEGLFSGCAVGIIHNDMQLSQLVLNELEKYQHDPRYIHHIAFLTSQFHLKNKQTKLALNYLVSQVHVHPDHRELRKVLANFIMQNSRKSEKHLKTASRIAESTIALQLRNTHGLNSSELGAKSLAMASEAMRCVDQHQRRKLAQRAVHINPTCREAWAALLLCSQ